MTMSEVPTLLRTGYDYRAEFGFGLDLLLGTLARLLD